MKIDSLTSNAIEWCALKSVPFVIFKEPGQKPAFFSASPDNEAKTGFFIGMFNKPFSENLWIPFERDAEQTWAQRDSLVGAPQQPGTPSKDTDKETYISDVSALISSLESRGHAKTVISTVETRCIPSLRLSKMVENLMDRSADCFCYCFYHAQAGLWLGATPELLLSASADGSFSTMALAGTLPQEQPWDDKNMAEHQYVCDFIETKLAELGAKTNKKPTKTVNYGLIKHLRTDFQGCLCGIPAQEVIDVLNPTPALCGWPVDEALADIAAIEQHRRECYGGCVGISADSELKAYVNIRCAHVRGSFVTVYAGGGIIALSSPIVEWNEAKIKRMAVFDKMI